MPEKKTVGFGKAMDVEGEAGLHVLRELSSDLSELRIHPSCIQVIWMLFLENHFVRVSWETDDSSRLFRTKRTAKYHLFLEGLYVLPTLTAVLQKQLTDESKHMLEYYIGTVFTMNRFRECLKKQGVHRPRALLVWLAREMYQNRVRRKMVSPCSCLARGEKSEAGLCDNAARCYTAVSGKLPPLLAEDRS